MYKNLLLVLTLFFTACSKNIPNLNERNATAFSLVENKNLKNQIIQTSDFELFSFQTDLQKCENIDVYIEGDGLAWMTKNIKSSDPTPLNPITLKLMLKDDSKCKIYIARPCQYTNSQNCNTQ